MPRLACEQVTKGDISWYLQSSNGHSPLRYLLQIPTSRFFFNFDEKKIPAEFKLVVRQNQNFQSMTHDVHILDFAIDIEYWIKECILAQEGSLLPPNQPSTLLPLTHHTILENEITISKRPLLWIKVESGDAFLMSRTDLSPLPIGKYFPIIEGAWISASSEVQLSIKEITDCNEESISEAIQTFQQWIIERWCKDYVDLENTEAERLEHKQQNEKIALTSAVKELVHIVDYDDEEAKVETDSYALWQACRCITESMKVALPPLKDDSLINQPDPLEIIVRMAHMRRRRVKLSSDWWQRDNGPLLGYFKEDNRPIALLPTSNFHYKIYDPHTGTTEPLTQDKIDLIQTDAWFLYRTFPDKPLAFLDLVEFSQLGTLKDWLRILWMVVLIGILSLFIPYGFGRLVEVVLSDVSNQQLYWLTMLLTGGAIANATCQLTRGLSVLRIQGITDNTLQTALWDRLLKLPVPFFRKYQVGDLGIRAMGINQIRLAFTGINLTNVLASIIGIFYFIFIMVYSRKIALMTLGLLAISFCVTVFAGWKMLRYTRNEAQLIGSVTGRVLQYITGIAKIRATSSELFAFSNWAQEYAQQQKNTFKAQFILCGVEAFNKMFPFIANVCLFLAVAIIFEHTTATKSGAAFLAVNAAFGGLIGLTLNLSQTLLQMMNVIPIYERLTPIIKTMPEIDEKKLEPGILIGSIETQGLSFRYAETSPWILQDISLSISPGEYVAIVGASGGGKSTFLRLLLGFEHADRGAIYYDNKDIASLDIISVRRQIGVVLQTSQLTIDSIFNNIVGSSPYKVDAAWEALKLVGLEQTVRALPMGIHTYVSEEGGMLSGGEKQLLLIARALVGKPHILFLDEATSSLDNRSQAVITNTLRSLAATRIVLAHRLSTVQHVDRIFVFKDTHLVESGTYDELLKKGGEFTNLARRQLV